MCLVAPASRSDAKRWRQRPRSSIGAIDPAQRHRGVAQPHRVAGNLRRDRGRAARRRRPAWRSARARRAPPARGSRGAPASASCRYASGSTGSRSTACRSARSAAAASPPAAARGPDRSALRSRRRVTGGGRQRFDRLLERDRVAARFGGLEPDAPERRVDAAARSGNRSTARLSASTAASWRRAPRVGQAEGDETRPGARGSSAASASS